MEERLLSAWQAQLGGGPLHPGSSFNLDFHSVPYYGEDPVVENHYVSMRSRSQPAVLVFLAQDAEARTFCYSNADIRKGEESGEVMRFIEFWRELHHELPRELVFDSRLTTYEHLAKIHGLGITFITLRRRSARLLREVALLKRSAWRTVELDVPARKYRTPRVYEQQVTIAGRSFRQVYVLDLGHDEPTILLTNDQHRPIAKLITRYAQRMLIGNALSEPRSQHPRPRQRDRPSAPPAPSSPIPRARLRPCDATAAPSPSPPEPLHPGSSVSSARSTAPTTQPAHHAAAIAANPLRASPGRPGPAAG